MLSQINAFLEANQTINVKTNEPLSKYTFTKTGGPADLLALPTSVPEVRQLLVAAKQNQLPITVIGNASNLIVRDDGISGLVIILTAMDQIDVQAQLWLHKPELGLSKPLRLPIVVV